MGKCLCIKTTMNDPNTQNTVGTTLFPVQSTS